MSWLCAHIIQDNFAGYVHGAALAASTYSVWKVRNMRIFQQQAWIPNQAVKQIIFDVRAAVARKRGVRNFRKQNVTEYSLAVWPIYLN